MSARPYSPEIDAWIARALDADILATAQRFGAQLKRKGVEHVGPCPRCGGTDRFAINTAKRVFNCRGSGDRGGGVVAMTMHLQQCAFLAAVEAITGEERPRAPRRGADAPPPPYDEAPPWEDDRRDEARDRRLQDDAADAHAREEKAESAASMFERGQAFAGSQAEAYLRLRGIELTPEQAADLRYAPELDYYGCPAKGEDDVLLGRFPAMLAAVRDVRGAIIGCHRTYLDAQEPIGLRPPGWQNAKKLTWGNARGGLIWLGPRRRCIAMGEGIETAASWYAFGVGPDDCTPVSAVSLGNLTGGSGGSAPHPMAGKTLPGGRFVPPGAHIPNGLPDMRRPGVVLPPEVEEVILLGDGDSDPYATRAKLLAGARRYRSAGREVTISMAPTGQDWNDVWLAARQEMAAA